jgi:hypothetical protein
MIKKMNKKNLLPVLAALFISVGQPVVFPSRVVAATVSLNTDNLSSFLNKYAGLSHSERDTLRSTDEYKGVADAVRALTSIDIMHLDLTQMLSPMESFMKYVPERDDFAELIDNLYYKADQSLDVRNVTRFWDNSSADSLKNNFAMMREVDKGTLNYTWVKRFYNKLSIGLMNFIVEYKDGAELAAEAIKNGNFYNSNLSINAQSKVKDFEKRAENNAAAELKSSTMADLVEKYDTAYTTNNWSETGKLESIFNEKLIEEKSKLAKVYGENSIKELMTLQDELYKKDKNFKYGAKTLHKEWLKVQLEVTEENLLSKLLSNLETFEELYRKNESYDRTGFRNKLASFVESNRSKFQDYYAKEYEVQPCDALTKLQGTLRSKQGNFLEAALHDLIRIQLEVLEELIVKKRSHALSSSTNSTDTSWTRVSAPSPYTRVDTESKVKKTKINENYKKEHLKDDNEDKNANESDLKLWSKKKLKDRLHKILPSILTKPSTLSAVLLSDEERGSEDKVVVSKANKIKREKIFQALLKINPSKVSKKLKTETKYSILEQFIQRAFTDDDEIDHNRGRVDHQVLIDLKIVPLEEFSRRLNDAYETNADLEESMHDKQAYLDKLLYNEIYTSPPTKLKKKIVLAYLRKIGRFVQFFKEHEDVLEVKNSAKKLAEDVGLTPKMMQNSLKISGMDKEDEDYPAVMMFSELLNTNNEKQKLSDRRNQKRIKEGDNRRGDTAAVT